MLLHEQYFAIPAEVSTIGLLNGLQIPEFHKIISVSHACMLKTNRPRCSVSFYVNWRDDWLRDKQGRRRRANLENRRMLY